MTTLPLPAVPHADFPHADFPHADFPHADFPHADFPHADTPDERHIRLLSTILAGDPGPLEWLMGTLKAVWGLWLILPTRTFAASPAAYRLALSVMPEWAWGLLMVVIGASQLAAWYADDRRGRFLAACAGTSFWFGFGSLMWGGDHRSAALAFQGTLAAFQGLTAVWLYQRLPQGRRQPQGTHHDHHGD